MGKIRNTESFILDCKKVHGNEFDYSLVKYIKYKDKVCIICHNIDVNGKEHGIFWQRADHHLEGFGCRKCQYEKISKNKIIEDKNYLIDKAKEKHGKLYQYGKIEKDYKVTIICKIHGKFIQDIYQHISGNGCPICKLSKGELKIKNWLEFNNFYYFRQWKFDDCKGKRRRLPFDFYLPEYNTCIEFDGKQHFDKRSKYYSDEITKNDKIKTQYCLDNNIKLIRISNFEKLGEILNEKFNR